jgi:hypothetical protein
MLLHQRMDPLTEALLMFAARREHVVQVLLPAFALSLASAILAVVGARWFLAPPRHETSTSPEQPLQPAQAPPVAAAPGPAASNAPGEDESLKLENFYGGPLRMGKFEVFQTVLGHGSWGTVVFKGQPPLPSRRFQKYAFAESLSPPLARCCPDPQVFSKRKMLR